jgi:peroxiredoxin (alkyl hydroperoxide reductase subunit C)
MLPKKPKGDLTMSKGKTVKIGQQVPDFELTVYEPENHGFGKRNLADLKSEGKWTILFFYPADFTFV